MTNVLLTGRAIWYPVPTTNWPILNASTYYWVAVSPGSVLSFNQPYNFTGIVWAGIDAAVINITTVPGAVISDPTGGGGIRGSLFSARTLRSQRFRGDNLTANLIAGINFVKNTENWATVGADPSYGSVRFKNWQAAGSTIKYGLQVTGIQFNPSSSSTQTGK